MTNLLIRDMMEEVREVNVMNGWRGNGQPEPTFTEAMELLCTETCEASDAWRKWGLQDATHHEGVECWCDASERTPCKPEGVGSEFADILIRFVDDLDIFDLPFHYTYLRSTGLGGGHASIFNPDASLLSAMLRMKKGIIDLADDFEAVAKGRLPHQSLRNRTEWIFEWLRTCADTFGIDLTFEYQRKMAFNRTRGYRHGGKRL